MTKDSADSTARERLSALVDGELEPQVVVQACTAWRDDAGHRATWHAYQLIGDVLRSDDLASEPSRDVAFLSALRGRLAAEPVVLAAHPIEPAGSPERVVSGSSRARGWTWVGASAVAAGFAAVAGVLVLTRVPGVPPTLAAVPGSIALSAAQPTPAAVVEATNTAAEPQALVANGKLIRDARLDRYLAAHKQFAGTSALGVPSGFLRSATADTADR